MTMRSLTISCVSVLLLLFFVSDTSSCDQSLKEFTHQLLLHSVNRSCDLYGSELISSVLLATRVHLYFKNYIDTIKRCVKSARNPALQNVHRLQQRTAFSKHQQFSLNLTLKQYLVTSPNNVCILECCQVVTVTAEKVTCMVFTNTHRVTHGFLASFKRLYHLVFSA